jgi:uncharacterized protein (TIGR02569 family)
VLKPVDDERQAAWVANLLATIETDDVVIPRPISTSTSTGTGDYVVDGWTATEFADAHHRPRRWLDIIAAGRALHRALAQVARPEWMGTADDWWRRADRVAFDDSEPAGDPRLAGLVHRLRAARRPIDHAEQLVHADLCGNVLFDDRDRPVVIDPSLFWRPVEYASAVVAIDAFEWEDAGDAALHWLDDVPDAHQLLLRAAIFRIATSAEVAAARGGATPRTLATHEATVRALERA